MEAARPEIKIQFTRSPEYRRIPVSGIWGGITGQGFIVADVFTEAIREPEWVKYTVSGEGQLRESERSPGEKQIVRELMVSLVITPEIAQSIAQWLLQQVRSIEQLSAHPSQNDVTEKENLNA